jgi:hypothetical protein
MELLAVNNNEPGPKQSHPHTLCRRADFRWRLATMDDSQLNKLAYVAAYTRQNSAPGTYAMLQASCTAVLTGHKLTQNADRIVGGLWQLTRA